MISHNIAPPTIRWRGRPESWTFQSTPLRDRRPTRRILIFILVVGYGGALSWTGQSVEVVLLTLLGVGFAGATIARWVVDGITPAGPQTVGASGGAA